MPIRKLLDILGIHLAEGARWRAELRPRFFAIVGSCMLLGTLLLVGTAKFSTSPAFCNSCHIMGPYYRAWKGSKHNRVACVDCHYPPGSPRTLLWKKFQAMSQVVKYATRTYSSKPFAEVEDASCLRSGCHSARLLEGRVRAKAKNIQFDHRPHLTETRRGRRLRCVSCHSQIVVGKHIEVAYDTCYLCHFKGMGSGRALKPLGGCLGCHDLPAKDFKLGNMTYNHRDFVVNQGVSCQNCHIDIVRGQGDAPQDRCYTCHNQPEKLARYGDIPFIHENHVTKHNTACFHCHQEIRHGIDRGEGGRPAAEPAPTLTFECGRCHEHKHAGQLEMYSGKVAGLGLPEMPSPMYLSRVDCIGCHYLESAGQEAVYTGKTFSASTQACVKCHGPKFKGIWQEQKEELGKTLARVREKLAAAKAALEKTALPADRRLELQKAVARAELWYHFVHASHGEHNIYLASLALRRADTTLTSAGEELQAELPDLSELPLVSGSYCATLCHEKVGVKVPPETVQFLGKAMPHKLHAGMMGCVKCHELGGHKRVPLKKDVQKTTCSGCHP